jgi:hypothetical protein
MRLDVFILKIRSTSILKFNGNCLACPFLTVLVHPITKNAKRLSLFLVWPHVSKVKLKISQKRSFEHSNGI